MQQQTRNEISTNLADTDSVEAMGEHPQATRIFVEAESLNQVYPQHRDRRLQFEAYEDEKRREEGTASLISEKRMRDAERMEKLREHREERRERIAQSYNKMYFPELASDGQSAGDGLRAIELGRKKLFSEIPRIQGERVVLDRVVETDAEALSDLVGNQLVQRYEPAFLFEKQFDDAYEAIRRMYGEVFQNKESLILAVRMKETGELAGLVEFYGLRDRLHKVSVGYRLRQSFWGYGLATEAARLMVGYLYGETDIEIITASTAVGNKASARVLEKVDFVRTARGVEEDWGFPEPMLVDKWFY